MRKGDQFFALGEYYDAAAEYRAAYSKTAIKDRDKRGERALKMAECYRRMNYTAKAIGAYQNGIRYTEKALSDRKKLEEQKVDDKAKKVAEREGNTDNKKTEKKPEKKKVTAKSGKRQAEDTARAARKRTREMSQDSLQAVKAAREDSLKAARVAEKERQKVAKAAHADSLKTAIDATGYTCLGIESAPYEKKGWFR